MVTASDEEVRPGIHRDEREKGRQNAVELSQHRTPSGADWDLQSIPRLSPENTDI